MAVQKPTLPKGTRDFGPADVQKRKYILNTIEQVFKKYGFMPLETPTMENLTTLEGKYGEEGDKLLFRIINSGDAFKDIKEKHADATIGDFDFRNSYVCEKGLRYDLTVPFARYVVMNRNTITFPFKRYQMQPVWRADRPQRGRYREFWQCDADVVGSDSLLNELDLIQIYDEAFRKLGIAYQIKINNRKILAGIAQVVKDISYMSTIAVAIDKLDKIGEDGVRTELIEQGFTATELDTLFSIISIKGDNVDILNALKTKLASSEEGLKGIDELLFVFKALSKINVDVNVVTDFSLARGLSYYTGCIFEVASVKGEFKSSIGGGGRYDNLTGIFGLPNVSGVGISFGLDRIYDVIEEQQLFPVELDRPNATKLLFCHVDEGTQAYCLPALTQLRAANIACEVYPDITKKIGKQIEYATALKIPFVAIAEEAEMAQGKFKLRNLETREQKECSVNELLELLR
jgi:histidyl-tRNA synthetase